MYFLIKQTHIQNPVITIETNLMTTKQITPKNVWEEMFALTNNNRIIYNYSCLMDMSDYVIVTDLFPKPVLEAYSNWNIGKSISQTQKSLFSNLRGGGQGDYRQDIISKINNVINALNKFPSTKRAVITIPNTSNPIHSNDDDAKCMREIHFRILDNTIHATVFFRAQAAIIFPKNIHFIGTLMEEVQNSLDSTFQIGNLYYLTSILVRDRQ